MPTAPRANPRLSRTQGKPDEKSRAKAENAQERAEQQLESVDPESWPRNNSGRPMAKLTMTASELLPTGQYANVSVGPCQITLFIDPEQEVEIDEKGAPHVLSSQTKDTLAVALNELAEIVEADVVAVQRNLVLEALQQEEGNGK